MKLRELLQNVQVVKATADMDMEIAHVAYDSRKVGAGDLFVAVAGFASDGNRFIPMAMEKGAACVVSAKPLPEGVPGVQVVSDRLALAQIGANYFGQPGKKLKLIGITGTNGKTSATLLLKYVIEQVLFAKVGLIGTMDNWIGDKRIPTERTTPESFELQGLLAAMVEAGCTYAIMEVSSHAIALDRVGGLHYEVAAFTNLTEDHLDFHKTMENYCDTKAELFARCSRAVANGDDPWCSRILGKCTCPVTTTSVKSPAGLWAENLELLPDGVTFTARYGQQSVPVRVPIPGKFTVYNALTVLGCALSLGISLEAAAGALATAPGVKGRVEVVPIDYAHTPDGLENVLQSVKGFCKGRVIVVFGCGGDRDPMKRPIMGKIATELADIAVITSDNPRTEEPMAIIQDILAGVDSGKKNYKVMENRPKAIAYAMDIGEKHDIIILAGKGHETYQEIQGVKHHLDEREVVAAYLEEKRN